KGIRVLVFNLVILLHHWSRGFSWHKNSLAYRMLSIIQHFAGLLALSARKKSPAKAGPFLK
ncbi:hypothetical protein ACXO4P_06950, partial [Lactobacillus delbrueckii subsp. bulgaricus]|nr:hypothetical protein [Lactobacillus delbrueckii subsp. bulgaricus]